MSPSERKIIAQKQQRKSSSVSAQQGLPKEHFNLRFEDLKKFKTSDLKSFVKVKRSKSETSLKSTLKATSTSWKDQKLKVKVKVEENRDELEKRREIASKKTPAELSQINSLHDIPLPTTLKRIITSTEKKQRSSEEDVEPVKFSTMLKTKLSKSWSNLEKTNGDSSLTSKPPGWLNAECRVRYGFNFDF